MFNPLAFIQANITKLIAGAAIMLAIVVTSFLVGKRYAAQEFNEYLLNDAAATLKTTQHYQKIVTVREVEYIDRVKTIKTKGETIIKEVPIYVTKADDDACVINAGFVRSYNASWEGQAPAAPSELDRRPTAVSLSTVAETNAVNATSCHVYKEQRDGIIKIYNDLRGAD